MIDNTILGQPEVMIEVPLEFIEDGVRIPSTLIYKSYLSKGKMQKPILSSVTFAPQNKNPEEFGEEVLNEIYEY